ncbi:ATP-binding protein [Actinomadura rupiterrae]|uniref:ATP-binding protein n=1 Tax=Actinomadura rupiterrae TaxID=559627 RepID=UPI0020A2685F|nr:AAA family ATPase [Actinomadura rupiterrae]MCP2339324.1 non-specific serine/threonine protein kinase [Actinomadura rupiterrae]
MSAHLEGAAVLPDEGGRMDEWGWTKLGTRNEPTGFIGRADELRAVGDALTRARIVTVTGPGGIGKTRIALRVVGQQQDAFPDGVAIVELSGLRNPEFLPHTVLSALGLPQSSARPVIEQLIEYFAERRALLVLDTCEHLVEAIAAFAEILVRNSAHLVLLLTSRQAVALPGEHVLVVPPMPAPDAESTEEGNDAVALFVARARAARPTFAMNDDNRAEVIALCRRLDGIPLAIELAAVRMRTMGLEQILQRFGDRFRFLAGTRALHARHQTLRATIEWTYQLCSDPERELWARLSVFAGGFTMAAVEEVCAGGELDGLDVIDLLESLVDKSVVQFLDDPDGDRYRMLDTLREFGAERLGGRAETYARRHQEFYLRVAVRAGGEWLSDQQVLWDRRLAADLDNFRVALDFAAEHPGGQAALRLVNGLWGMWLSRSRLTEARRWLDKAMSAEPEHTAEYGHALFYSCYFGVLQTDPAVQDDIVRLAAVAERLDDDRLRGRAIHARAHATVLFEPTTDALPLFADVCALAAETGDRFVLATGHMAAAGVRGGHGDPTGALDEVERGLALLEPIPEERWSRNSLRTMQVLSLFVLGRLDEAREQARAVLPSLVEQDTIMSIAATFEYLSWIAAAGREHELAALLMGGSGRLWKKVGSLLWGEAALNALHTANENILVSSLGAEQFERHYARGANLPVQVLADLARAHAPKARPPAPPDEDGSPLGPSPAANARWRT